jgi:hypothetical protein
MKITNKDSMQFARPRNKSRKVPTNLIQNKLTLCSVLSVVFVWFILNELKGVVLCDQSIFNSKSRPSVWSHFHQ